MIKYPYLPGGGRALKQRVEAVPQKGVSNIDKPACLIIRLLFGFASYFSNSTNLQIVERQCYLKQYAA